MTLRVGLDIGGTKTAAVVVDHDGQVLGRAVRPTDGANPDALIGATVETVKLALSDSARPNDTLIAAGVGVPGQVDPASGTVRLAVNLNLREPFRLREALQEALGVPVALENDVRAAAWGAYHWARSTQPLTSLAYLSVGTGIAAGLVLDGRLYRGAHGMAGEIGHIPMDPAGPRCVCGATGCLEAIAAGPAISAAAARANIRTHSGRPPSTKEVFSLAAGGHPEAVAIVDHAAGFLSRAIYLLLMTYDVEKVVLGGGVTQSGDAFEQPLRNAMKALRANSALVASMMPDEKAGIVPPHFHAGVMGAVQLALDPGPVLRQGGE